MRLRLHTKLPLSFLLLIPIFLSSCSSINRNIYISRESNLNSYNLNVDLVGVSRRGEKSFTNVKYADYWTNQALREKFAIKEVFLRSNKKNKLLFSMKNPIWKTWGRDNSSHLFIVSNVDESLNGSNWKKEVRLAKYSWFNFWSDRDLYIKVTKDGINIKKTG